MPNEFTLVVSDSARIRPELAGQNFTISPDGSTIVYAGGAAISQLYARSLNDLATSPIPGTEGANNPFFSPDGQWMGYRDGTYLKKVRIDSKDVPLKIAESDGLGATWGPDDPIPSSIRPPDSSSIVAAVIAVIAALRPGIWKIADPSLILLVPAASQASTVAASDPYASAAQTES